MHTWEAVRVLEVDDVRVSYGTTRAVRGISISIADGEAVCLIGPNGAGKTSLLAAISGSTKAQGGLRFAGEDIGRLTSFERAVRGLVLVPEGRRVFADLTVHENILVGATSAKGRQARFRPDDAYDIFPALRRLRARRGGLLSGGEQQMVALARGLLGSPRLLMVDEPSLGLAPAVCRQVYDALAQISGEVAVLVVEQNTADALSLCDRGYVVASGEVVLSGSSADLADREALVEAYLGTRDVGRASESRKASPDARHEPRQQEDSR